MAKITVVGPGAMGSLFAALLSEAGNQVWLLDKHRERAALISQKGVTVEREGRKRTVEVKAAANPDEPPAPDLMVFCVKAYHTMEAARASMPAAGERAEVLSLQNGVGNVDALIQVFGQSRVLGGTTSQGANLVEPGYVRHAGTGETVIGQPDGGEDRAKNVADMFNQAGIKTSTTNDLDSLVWSKLIINAAINPLTALLAVKNGALPGSEQARAIMAEAVDEVVRVCENMGVRLAFYDPLEKSLAVAEATGENISSMLQDVRAGRRTEVDEINGAVAREAQRLGLHAPVNLLLTRIIKAIQET